ncbi:phosphoribosyltransferase [Parasphingorhabdus sp.]|uniref:phosphoribosyltransferase n=1 Tax=Parasphingorhabdus sp. TaxID=2709688 RepID=UPI002F93CC63
MDDGTIPFDNRQDAGRKLARKLSEKDFEDPLIMALPRGGVPVAHEVAKALGAEMDLLFVKKIGAPDWPEYGIGAVVDGTNPQIVLTEEIVRQLRPSPEYIDAEVQRQLKEIARRRVAYLGDRQPIEMKDRTVIIVDDGIATGGTVKAALKGVRKNQPRRIILAVPVAPLSTLEELKDQCDEIVCLSTPTPFGAVGSFYRDFDQTSDSEVISLMASTHN